MVTGWGKESNSSQGMIVQFQMVDTRSCQWDMKSSSVLKDFVFQGRSGRLVLLACWIGHAGGAVSDRTCSELVMIEWIPVRLWEEAFESILLGQISVAGQLMKLEGYAS